MRSPHRPLLAWLRDPGALPAWGCSSAHTGNVTVPVCHSQARPLLRLGGRMGLPTLPLRWESVQLTQPGHALEVPVSLCAVGVLGESPFPG